MPYPLKELIFLTLVSTLILFVLLVLYMLLDGHDRLIRFWIKRKILKNPWIGQGQGRELVYRSTGYEYRYRLKEILIPRKKATVEWISRKQWVHPLTGQFHLFPRFWPLFLYWTALDLRMVAGILLIVILLSFGLFTPPSFKEALLEQIVMRVSGIQNATVSYEQGGWVKVEAVRYTAVDRQPEPVEIRVQPLHWVMFGRPATVTRYRGDPYGPVTYEVHHDAMGRPIFMKDGEWVKGQFKEGKIVWERPQGTGIREGKVLGHEGIRGEEKKKTFMDTEGH